MMIAGCGGAGTGLSPAPSGVDITGWPSVGEPSAATEGTAFPACPGDRLLAAVRGGLPIADGRSWASVAVQNCAGGYARVFATPTAAVEGERELVFLHDAGGSWTVVASGTGLRCGADGDQEVATACRALGLS